MNILIYKDGFKIKKKSDVTELLDKVLQKDNIYQIIINSNEELIIEVDKDRNISILIRQGNLNDIFNPSFEVTRTKDNSYDITVEDYIWINRKLINHKLFSKER